MNIFYISSLESNGKIHLINTSILRQPRVIKKNLRNIVVVFSIKIAIDFHIIINMKSIDRSLDENHSNCSRLCIFESLAFFFYSYEKVCV